MADEKTPKRRGHPVKGRNRGGQLRALHAKGVLKSSGKGKGRKTSYTPGRTVIGGSKAAGLRSGSGSGGGRSVTPSRADRIAAGRKIANRPDVARKALKGSGLRVTASQDKGPRLLGAGSGPLTATGKRTRMAGDTRFLVRTARKDGKLPDRWNAKGGGRGTTDGIRASLRSHTLGHNGTSLKNSFGLLAKEHGVPVQRIRQEAQHLARTERTFGTSKRGKFSDGVTSGGQNVAGIVRGNRQRAVRARLEAQGATNANSKAMRNLTRAERIAASTKVAQRFFGTKRGESLRTERMKAGSSDAFKALRRAQAAKRRKASQ